MLKKTKCIFLCFLWTVFLLSGCQKSRPTAAVPPAVAVEIQVSQSSSVTPRRYRQPWKMQRVFFWLRTADFAGRATENPELFAGERCDLQVMLSDGRRMNYHLRGGCYMNRDNSPWDRIDPDSVEMLLNMLRKMPGD